MSRPFISGNSVWITTVAFQQLFEGIEVRNFDHRYGNVVKRIPVQVSLDTKEKLYYQIRHGGYKAMEQEDIRLPRLSIQITDIQPAMERQTGKEQKRFLFKNSTDFKRDIQPIPFNISYTVGIWAKYFEHYSQILENILAWFDPYVTVGVKERNLNLEREIKVQLGGIGQNSTFKTNGSGKSSDDRIIKGELTFTAETFMYKVLNEDPSDIIENVQISIIDIRTPVNSQTISISGEQFVL